MDRVATLSENELKILELIRASQNDHTTSVVHQAGGDIRRELEDIYHTLTNLQPYSQNEELNEVTRRIYNMLY